jgi:DNA gyrase subunit B (EC 5.99.1.3)
MTMITNSSSVPVRREGKEHFARFERGVVIEKLRVIGDACTTGTTITFKPDPEIFEDVNFDADTLASRLMDLAFLNKNVIITFKDERTGREEKFHYEGGIVEFVRYINKTKNVLHDKPIYITGQRDDVLIEAALQYTDSYSENIHTFVNNINTIEGGTHLIGLGIL